MSFHSVLLGTRFESLAAVAQVRCKNNWQIGITKQWVTAKEEEINLVSSLVKIVFQEKKCGSIQYIEDCL